MLLLDRRLPAAAASAASAAFVIVVAALLPGCAGTPGGKPALDRAPIAACAIMVQRPFKAIPEPDRFIQGVLVGLTEGIVRSGYDFGGVVRDDVSDPDDVQELLGDKNARLPGTAAIHLVFVEAPTLVGFGTTYTSITCTVYDPRGRVLRTFETEPPARRAVVDLLLPRLRPDADGRSWAERLWTEHLETSFPHRG